MAGAPHVAPLPPALAAGLVFLASGSVLVLEILGVRLLAPYVGLTLETTTSIIGVVLAGIAMGAALGGRAADAMSPRQLLCVLFLVGGALALLTVPTVRALGPAAQGGGDGAALVLTVLALLPPAAVLSAVTPVVARTQLSDLRTSGTVFGRLSAWATAGALAGTFGTGFVLVPNLAVSVSVLLVGGVLIASGVGLGLAVGALRRRSAGGAALVAVALAAIGISAGSPCEVESTYHCARVVADPARPGGRTLVLDDLRHSYADLEDPRHLEFAYVRWIGDAVDAFRPARTPIDGVYVGGGGFTLPRYVAATRPRSQAEVLEVDPALVGLVRRRLGVEPSPSLKISVGDARVTLRGLRAGSADLVVGDAFGSLAVPWHLATREWVADVRRVLRPDGLYALNLIDQGPLDLARAEAATLLEAFEDVRLISTPGSGNGNLVLLAANVPLGRDVRSSAEGARTLDRAAVARFARGSEPLRDDDAPADQLLSTG